MILIESDFKEDHYIYAESFKIGLSPTDNIKDKESIFPEPQKHFDPFIGEEALIYMGRNTFKLILTLDKSEENQPLPTKVEITYRGCSKKVCYLTRTESYKIDLEHAIEPATNKKSILEDWLSRGFILALIASFIAGIISSLTPCIYPIIPIVVATIAANVNRAKGLVLSAIFTAGLAIVYSILGLLAGKSGIIVGSLLNNFFIIVTVSLIFLAMGLSLIGIYELKLPHKITGRLSSIRGHGYLGAFLTGLVTGIVALPCVGPFAGSILALAAQSSSLIKGFTLLCSFSLGMGVLFILIGAFSHMALKLPKPGAWMIILKKTSGTIMILVALYFLRFAIPSSIFPLIAFLVLTIISIAFKIVSKRDPLTTKTDMIISRVSLVIAILILFAFIFPNRYKALKGKNYEHDKSITWHLDEREALSLSGSSKKNVLVDFYADWCESCGELDRYTFKDINVIDRSKDFIFLRIDLSSSNKENEATARKYSVLGLPSIIFLCTDGREAFDSRLTGFISPDKLIKHMDGVNKRCFSE